MNIATEGSNDAFDRLFLIACAFLVIGGIVMLASASLPISMKQLTGYDLKAYYYVKGKEQTLCFTFKIINGLILSGGNHD